MMTYRFKLCSMPSKLSFKEMKRSMSLKYESYFNPDMVEKYKVDVDEGASLM